MLLAPAFEMQTFNHWDPGTPREVWGHRVSAPFCAELSRGCTHRSPRLCFISHVSVRRPRSRLVGTDLKELVAKVVQPHSRLRGTPGASLCAYCWALLCRNAQWPKKDRPFFQEAEVLLFRLHPSPAPGAGRILVEGRGQRCGARGVTLSGRVLKMKSCRSVISRCSTLKDDSGYTADYKCWNADNIIISVPYEEEKQHTSKKKWYLTKGLWRAWVSNDTYKARRSQHFSRRLKGHNRCSCIWSGFENSPLLCYTVTHLFSPQGLWSNAPTRFGGEFICRPSQVPV